MADNTVQIILSAVDNASAVIKGEKTALSGLADGFKNLTGFSLSSAGAMAAAGVAMNAVINYTKQAISETNDYVSSVTDMSRVLGISTEDTSKLIQASDDLFISQDKLNTALLAASRQGIDVSINGLKSLSEQYLSLNPGVERAQFLMKTFGRSGSDMGKLLEQGSSGIDAATSSISKNMIVTEQSQKVVYDYKKSLDALDDAFQGIKYRVGEEVMPTVTDFNTVIAYGVQNLSELDIKTNETLSTIIKFTTGAIIPGFAAIENLLGGVGALADKINDTSDPAARAADRFDIMSKSVEDTTGALEDLKNEYSSVSSLANDLQSSQEDLLAAEKELSDYVAANPMDSSGIQERKDKIDDLKDAQDEMVKKWMLNVYQQMLTADGDLSESDMQFLLDYQVNSGLISQENADRAMSYWNQANDIIAANVEIQNSINNLQGKEITITTIYRSLTSTGTAASVAASIARGVASGEGLKHPHANGGSWVIPSAYGYEGYPMGGGHTASAGETVTVTPPGKSGGMSDEQLDRLAQLIQVNNYQMMQSFIAALSVSQKVK